MQAGPAARALLDHALESIRHGEVQPAFDGLVAGLAEARRAASPREWDAIVRDARAHPLREVLHRDPFTYRCYAKPRGYCPDGVALDYVLRGRELRAPSADPVAQLHHCTTRGATARALRFRRDAIAREVDAIAERAPRPLRAFAAGCGRLRECDRLKAFASGRLGAVVAFDLDLDNLDGVRRDYAGLPVVTHHGSLQTLADARATFGECDVAWCAGLLETLPPPAAAGLARALFAMLAPGGTLLLAQFLPTLPEAAFLEAFMDWKMAYRTQAEIFALVRELPDDTVRSWQYSESPESTVGLVAVRRR